MIDIGQLREHIIRPACAALGYGGPAPENLLLVSGMIESGYMYLKQKPNGPALGYWQVEPATHDSLWADYLSYRGPLRSAVTGLTKTAQAQEMIWNLRYACAIARIKYLQSPIKMPDADDMVGMGNFYKRCYNTAGGASTSEKWAKAWRQCGLPV